jgi:hypothetical protein
MVWHSQPARGKEIHPLDYNWSGSPESRIDEIG